MIRSLIKTITSLRPLNLLLISGIGLISASCGDDAPEPDNPPLKPIVSKEACPRSISQDGEDIFWFSYDQEGRMTYMSLDGQLEYTITYDPLTIRIGDEFSNTTLHHIQTNAAGFVTSAAVHDTGGDDYRYSFEYDGDNRLLKMSLNGVANLEATWVNGNLVKLHSHTGNEIFIYSETENPAGAVSPFWGALAPLWLTRLFGVVPAHLPQTSTDPDHTLSFSYSLNGNHSIGSESIIYHS